MKMAIAAFAGLLVAGLYMTQPAQAQNWQYQTAPQPYGYQTAPAQPYGAPQYGAPQYGERHYVEPRSGSDVRARCIGLHREAEHLRVRMDREWNPLERARTEGRLRELQNDEARAGCR